MALKILQSGIQPLGVFDGLDSEASTLKGGEVVTLGSVLLSAGDKGAADVDGYAPPGTKKVVVTKTLTANSRPLFLADEGDAGYGTLFGELVGAAVGQSTGGTRLGPHTTAGSGKVTCWDKPGLYAVTLDAVHTDVAPSVAACVTGAPLYFTTAGKLTTDDTLGVVVARFVEFTTNRSLVTSPRSLVEALHSPSGTLSPSATAWTEAVIHFRVED
jgi:hypothetical protein